MSLSFNAAGQPQGPHHTRLARDLEDYARTFGPVANDLHRSRLRALARARLRASRSDPETKQSPDAGRTANEDPGSTTLEPVLEQLDHSSALRTATSTPAIV